MRTLIYKRTHTGDPNPAHGVFGECNCMHSVRGRLFDAVIGVGGVGIEPRSCGIAGKITWVGIGAHKHVDGDPRQPKVSFDHFWCRDADGPAFADLAPKLAERIYRYNIRTLMHPLSPELAARWGSAFAIAADSEVEKILNLARNADPFGNGAMHKAPEESALTPIDNQTPRGSARRCFSDK
jgi:hypothetical protein